jgi:hypothetical protein
VDFKSAEGTGTIFRFHIPIVASSPEARPEYTEDATVSPRVR